MRLWAGRNGYHLSEHELYKETPEQKYFYVFVFFVFFHIMKYENRKLRHQKGAVVEPGIPIHAETEKDIFDLLSLKYVPPEERNA